MTEDIYKMESQPLEPRLLGARLESFLNLNACGSHWSTLVLGLQKKAVEVHKSTLVIKWCIASLS
jgi:hypothetical protein